METKLTNQDNRIIDQLKDGSKEAFHFLYDAYGPKIHSFALSYLKNSADAEELLQEVFLKLWEIRSSLDSSKNIKSFLFKISINLIYDFIRRRNIEQAYIDYTEYVNHSSSDKTWHEVIYNEMVNNLQLLVSKMPVQRQRIFRLSKEEGLSNDEISTQLNLSRRTVENQLYRAVSSLKEKLGTGSLAGLLFFFLHCK